MRRPALALGAVLCAAMLLAGCGAGPGTKVSGSGGSGIAVDTPELRQAKQAAGIADCPVLEKADPVKGGLPAHTLPCLGGGPAVDLTRLRGPMVINLWAQWCKPCREELPFYQRFATAYAGKVQVIGIDWQDTRPADAIALAHEAGVTYPLLADPDPKLRAAGLPKIILIDAAGKVVHEQYKEIKAVKELEQMVAKHLGVPGVES